jgi:hypothetical protein
MNNSQLKAIKKFISTAEKFFHYESEDAIHYTNGPVIWSIEKMDGNYWLRGNNITNEQRWYDSLVSINVLIGPKGGIKVYSAEGIAKESLIR